MAIISTGYGLTSPAIIKSGFLYSVIRDQESSYQLVKKYRIKNWDRIKKAFPDEAKKLLDVFKPAYISFILFDFMLRSR